MNETATLIDSFYGCVKKSRYGYMLYNKFDMYIGRSFDLYGEFSYGESKLFEQIVKSGDVVLDIGANIGAFTLLFSKLVTPQGSVFAFEPQRVVFQMLCANAAMNSCTNVHTINKCVGKDYLGVDVLELDQYKVTNFGGLSIGSDGKTPTIKVGVVVIDDLMLGRCDFIKIDVEGMERDVLLGATETIKRCKPIMYIENDRAKKSAELISTISELGYVIYEHNPYLYNADNYFGCKVNIFGNIVSKNLLCVHRSVDLKVDGLKEL